MDERKIAKLIVFSVALFTIGFLTFGTYHFYRQGQIVHTIEERGVEVTGIVSGKSKSSGDGSASVSYIVEVEYTYQDEAYTHSYSVISSWWSRLEDGDRIQIYLDPERPTHSILGTHEGEQVESTGFVIQD